jgi:hypothetical protein
MMPHAQNAMISYFHFQKTLNWLERFYVVWTRTVGAMDVTSFSICLQNLGHLRRLTRMRSRARCVLICYFPKLCAFGTRTKKCANRPSCACDLLQKLAEHLEPDESIREEAVFTLKVELEEQSSGQRKLFINLANESGIDGKCLEVYSRGRRASTPRMTLPWLMELA